MKARTVGKKNQFKGQHQQNRVIKTVKMETPAMPVNTAESNAKGDMYATAMTYGLIAASVAVLIGGSYYAITGFQSSLVSTPINWPNIVWMTLVLVATLLLARSLFWLSMFGAVMLATRMGAWKSLETTCKRVMKLPPTLSRGTSWASLALLQSLVTRGQYKEALEVADTEWTRSGENPKEAQNMGPLCVTAGIASQVENDTKAAMEWNNRAIAALNKSMEQLQKPNKGLLEKLAATQAKTGDWEGQLKTQLMMAHFQNANILFSKMDQRRAKENYKKVVEYSNNSPDFPQKSDIIKVSREQLSRLKHS
jgi:hypothetical protein